MIANQIIQTSIDELKAVARVDLKVLNLDGSLVASTYDADDLSIESINAFVDSPAESQGHADNQLFKVYDEEELGYILVAKGSSDESYMIGRIAANQLKNLIIAYKERFDKNNFFQNLIMDNMLLVDIYNKAKKLRIPVEQKRCVFLVEVMSDNNEVAKETLKGLFTAASGDYVTSVDERNLIIIKSLEEEDSYPELAQTAKMILDMLETEAMVMAHVTYGTMVGELREVSKSYKEARMALDVGKIFYEEKSIIAYNTLGIGRLIYQLPTTLCELFMKEIFGDRIPDDLDDEMLATINKFFENNLNVSETSRQLYVHRNTLVYRIEKLLKSTGLDIRCFDDALTLKIALMVVNYMRYLEENGEV